MAISNKHGLPLALYIAPGNRHDVALTEPTLDSAFVDELPPRLIADKAWDSSKHQEMLAARGIELIAPKREGLRVSRRQQDGRSFRRYRKRWKVERLFAWLKQYRRINTRWEWKAENYLGFVHLAAIVLIVRRFWDAL